VGGGTAYASPVHNVSSARAPGDNLPFASAVFRATHNSYSGNIKGTRGSILAQLDGGVRFLEFDVQDNGFAGTHDYAIGHDEAGHEVDHQGNPASNALRDWLRVVADWSAAHPAHAPLLVMLDLKDDLTDNPSFAAGNLTALNAELRGVFGARLLLARDVAGALPTVGALRGRVLTLLSGDVGTRAEYRRDVGYHPAVALNGRGQVVEVHDSGAGTLWYWTGTYGADGRVTWLRHGRYDTGTTPAVALNDNGWLVEVHKSENENSLWYHVGLLGADGDIVWWPSHRYDNGILPTVAFLDASGTRLREVHRSQSNAQNWEWQGTLDAGGAAVAWTANRNTADPRYNAALAVRGSAQVAVWTGADGTTPTNTLRYSTDRVSADRIRYQQWAFVEYQAGDSAELRAGTLFSAAMAGDAAFIVAQRREGRVVRGWDFDDPGRATTPLANYPATNYPFVAWYTTLTDNAGAVR
jgi:hypothetical protein